MEYMEEKQLRKQLNKYTKEQIIDGILREYYSYNVNKLIVKINSEIERKKIVNEYNEYKEVSDNLDKASDAYCNYIDELKIKYGDKVNIGQLTKVEFDKLLSLTSAYETANKKFLDNIRKDNKRRKQNENSKIFT